MAETVLVFRAGLVEGTCSGSTLFDAYTEGFFWLWLEILVSDCLKARGQMPRSSSEVGRSNPGLAKDFFSLNATSVNLFCMSC